MCSVGIFVMVGVLFIDSCIDTDSVVVVVLMFVLLNYHVLGLLDGVLVLCIVRWVDNMCVVISVVCVCVVSVMCIVCLWL